MSIEKDDELEKTGSVKKFEVNLDDVREQTEVNSPCDDNQSIRTENSNQETLTRKREQSENHDISPIKSFILEEGGNEKANARLPKPD